MTDQTTKDLFGRDNQGENYDKFRPCYPPKFFEIISQSVSHKSRYLDVGCGTGQLLLRLSKDFQFSLGTDISQKQLEVLQKKITTSSSDTSYSVKVQKCDSKQLINLQQDPFDLVTVGQALHWFDVDQFLNDMNSTVLAQGNQSVLAIAGYFCSGFDIQHGQDKLLINCDDLYEEYYQKIKQFYDFDRNHLFSHYGNYNFSKHFNLVTECAEIVRDESPIDSFIKYLRTSSAYNTLMEKNQHGQQQEQSFKDPSVVVLQKINQRANQNKEKQQQLISISRKTSYFLKIFKRKGGAFL